MALCLAGSYEPDMCELLRDLLSEDSVFVDLGANEGYFSVAGALRVGPGGKVVAVEPQARLMSVIRENCALNGVEQIVTVENVAVSDKDGNSQLFLTPSLNTGASGLYQSTRYRLPRQEVRLERLVTLLDRLSLAHVDLLKVDVEGYEYEVILGSPEVFRSGRVRAIALEFHPAVLKSRNRPSEEIVDLLESSGYRIDPRYPNLFAREQRTPS
jgi:FkbM family methyltransferase